MAEKKEAPEPTTEKRRPLIIWAKAGKGSFQQNIRQPRRNPITGEATPAIDIKFELSDHMCYHSGHQPVDGIAIHGYGTAEKVLEIIETEMTQMIENRNMPFEFIDAEKYKIIANRSGTQSILDSALADVIANPDDEDSKALLAMAEKIAKKKVKIVRGAATTASQ
jgi:hypothetical protein